MNEIVISRIPVSRETTPTLCAHQTYVSRETSPNTQPQHKNLTVKLTQKDPQQANHQKAVTHRSLFSRWKNPFMPTDDKLERIRYCLTFP